MRTQCFPHTIPGLKYLFAIAGLFILQTVQADPSTSVTIRGWLHAGEKNLADAMVVVEVDGETCVRSILLRNGRFEFSVPVGGKARLLFEKPGFITKEVVVDTRNANAGTRYDRSDRKLKFDVVLESMERKPDLVYAGPVGSIGFVKGTGAMQVRHERRMVASRVE